jgi:hypothetical protein
MWSSRALAALLILALALVPAVGFAGSELSASPTGKHHSGRVHHQPDRAWRTVPATPARAATAPVVTAIGRASAVETLPALPLVARVVFVPPRA